MRDNPFTPYFGEIPPIMAGRGHMLRSMDRALSSGSRSPELTSLLSGARGTGKTALLSAVAEMASSRGWAVANVTALPGMLDDIAERTVEAAPQLSESTDGHLTGIGIGSIVSASWEHGETPRANWRTRMNRLLDSLSQTNTGLLITVDEVRADIDEVRQLVATYQHFTREHRKVALLLAGLPYGISSLVNDKSVSFLRRAHRVRLERIADAEVAAALNQTVLEAGAAIEGDALALAVDATRGFPFMLQLIGYRMWEHARGSSIAVGDAEYGITTARDELYDQVLDATLMELSDMDVAFLQAMLLDRGYSSMSDVAERMGKTYTYAAQYRRRLLEAGVIGERGRGKVGFELPFFEEFLRERLDVGE